MKQLRPDDLELIKLPCGLYGGLENEWYQQLYGHQSYKKGDMISFGLRRIISDEDKSDWAREAHDE